MNRNRRIFIVIFIAFTALIILLTVDMARQTTAPWNRRREVERAFPAGRDATIADSLAADADSLLKP